MRFLFQQILLLNLQALVVLTMLPIATAQDPPIAKAGCLDKCGDLSIPYPFGTTEACYYSYHFWVTCNDTFFNPPRLIWQDSTIQIKKISLLGQMTVMQFVAYDCDYRNGSRPYNNPKIKVPDFFTVNITANKFTIVGCDSYGFVYGWRRTRNYSTGCTASCSSKDDLDEDSCMGSGCCQTWIPRNVSTVLLKVNSYHNYSYVRGISNCTYGFLIETSAFRFSPQNLTNLKGVEKLPMVVDWAIGNGTSCEEAKRNSTGYACKSENSLCHMPKDNGYGYRCLCEDGYEGNPYIIKGCRDVDECNPASGQKYPCQYKCVNTPGGFECPCPKGHHGDGKIDGKGCSRGELHTVKLVAGIAIGVILLLLLSCLAFVGHIRRQSERAKQKWFIQNGGNKLLERLAERGGSPNVFKIFTSSDLKKATNDFHKDNIVGQGGFGIVYRGLLSDKRTTVAIKKSKIVDENQVDQFVNEVAVISQTNHRNIVKLLGCCLETEIPLLVYEFISNGTLHAHLHDPTRASLLTWEKRLRIAAETANVLWYLHSTASIPIIHRDVKSDNILLDHTFTAKVSDFGASRLIAMDQNQISTIVQGTVGYLDPEYLETQQLTTKSDVYSFGVVLLELLTRRKVVNDVGPEGERSLVLFSRSLLKQEDDSFLQIIDGNIVSEENREQLMKVARLAERCLKMSGEERPSMNIVAMELEALRVGIKQSHPQTGQDANVMEPSHVEGFEGIISGGCDSSASAGFDSFGLDAIPQMSGGR